MRTQITQTSSSAHSKISPGKRGNFSQCGKLCDQTFYLQNPVLSNSQNHIEIQIPHKKSPIKSTIAFTSVPRQKRGNFRFSIALPFGEFNNKPDHLYGRSKSPSWSFPKKQRYGNDKVQQFEVCRKHPILKKDSQQKFLNMSTTSFKQSVRHQVSLNKNTHTKTDLNKSSNETMDNSTKNYSIIMPRKKSAIDFFSKTKIKNPFYLTKQQVMNEQQQLEGGKVIEPCPKGYIEFTKKRPRQPNNVSKGFQTFMQTYSHEKQFNNFELTKYPTHPQHHIDFNQHLPRDLQPRTTKGPNLQLINIDYTRVNKKNINLYTSKFVQKIRTRFDRVEPEPHTRISYDPHQKQLPGMVSMERVIGRNKELFPVIDPAIKKSGDFQQKQILRQSIPIRQINEAMRPKCNSRIQL